MINLFAKTKAEYSEEDRLTNAFMAVLQHSDPAVLNALLHHIDPTLEPVEDTSYVEFDLQVPFQGSRPDGRIRTAAWQIIIETKRFDPLCDEQFQNHWSNLEHASRRTILLSLTSALRTPDIVDQLNSQQTNHHRTANHLSWSQVLKTIYNLKAEFLYQSKTHFLLSQLEGYLRHLNYDYIEGNILNEIKDYGHQLMAISHHEQHTNKQLHARLKRLSQIIDEHMTSLCLEWRIKSWSGSNKATPDRVNFDYLNADVKGLSKARYRVLPTLKHQGEPELFYYLTYSREPEHWNQVMTWMAANEDNIQSTLGPLHRFGYLGNDTRIFHINQRVSDTLAQQFFGPDETALTALGKEMAHFFESVDELVQSAIKPA